MRPDRRGPRRPFHGRHEPEERTLLPFEPIDDAAVAAVAAVEAALSDAGRRARADRAPVERPDPAFAAALRERLVAQLPAGTATTDGATGARDARVLTPGVAAPPMADAGRPQRVVGRLAWTGPRLATPPRWAAALVAAVFVVAAIGFGPGRDLFTAPAPSRATDVAGATLVRGGAQIALTDGTQLRAGDEVRTATDGRAMLVLGGSLARLDGGADVVLQTVDDTRIVLDQRAGRVYHRVAVPAGGTYAVSTAGITWTAHGTAFDIETRATSSGGTRIDGLAIQHDLIVAGPGISATIAEGRRAEIVLAGPSATPDLTTGSPTLAEMDDPWLAANARLDAAAGFDPGILLALLATEPPASAPVTTPEPTPAEPTAEPTSDPSAPVEPTTPPATPTPPPTEKPQPTPTPKATPKPTPTPKPIADLGLVAKACPGGTLLDWTSAPAAGFHHYKTYWSGSSAFSDPTIVDGSSTMNRAATSTVDVGATDARWYRTYAYDAAGHVVARSPIRAASGEGGATNLGTLSIGPDGPNTLFSWPEIAASESCYSATKLVYSNDGEPIYGEPGTTLLWWTGTRTTDTASVEAAPAGTWWFRVQVLLETSLRTVVVSQTNPVQYTIP